MKKVGLTGGIGSGKSVVARFLQILGVPVYDSDLNARRLMHSNEQLVSGVKALLGEQAYVDGQLNRAFIGQSVFNDKLLLEQLNQLVHPVVKTDFEDWCRNRASKHSVVVQEAAILFENGSYSQFDHMVLVKAPLEQRIKRVMDRDGVSRAKVLERINNQWDDEKKEKLSDSVIMNDDRHSLIVQITNLLNNL